MCNWWSQSMRSNRTRFATPLPPPGRRLCSEESSARLRNTWQGDGTATDGGLWAGGSHSHILSPSPVRCAPVLARSSGAHGYRMYFGHRNPIHGIPAGTRRMQFARLWSLCFATEKSTRNHRGNHHRRLFLFLLVKVECSLVNSARFNILCPN